MKISPYVFIGYAFILIISSILLFLWSKSESFNNFNLFDTNNSKTIDMVDIKTILRGLLPNFNPNELIQIATESLQKLDKNGNGKIDKDEFYTMIDKLNKDNNTENYLKIISIPY